MERRPIRALFISIVLGVSCAASWSADTNDVPVFTYPFSIHSQKYVLEFLGKDLDSSPDWEKGATEPPISPNEAYRRAKRALDMEFPRLHNVTCNDKFFERRIGSDGKYHVYYYIMFSSPDIDALHLGSTVEIFQARFIVLMDGRVISPRRIDEK